MATRVPLSVMKIVSEDKSYVDYTHENRGVRVWKDHCQAIYRADEDSDWLEKEANIPVPVPDSILGFPHGGVPATNALALEVAKYDDKVGDPELRAVVKGWMTFEEALASP
jgi:hypothetical protein